VLPSAGLETWFETAQAEADEAYEEQAAALQAERDARPGRTAAELRAEVAEEPDWLVPGILHRRWAHKFGGREKQAGKGTLVTNLLGKLERGEDSVFGPSSATASAVILTEEPPESIREKLDLADIQRSRIIYGWELSGLLWPDKVKALIADALDFGHEVVYIENIARSAGIVDESGTELARACEVASDACAFAGITLLIDHHHRKSGGRVEDLTRTRRFKCSQPPCNRLRSASTLHSCS
jgi:hypothetical protein